LPQCNKQVRPGTDALRSNRDKRGSWKRAVIKETAMLALNFASGPGQEDAFHFAIGAGNLPAVQNTLLPAVQKGLLPAVQKADGASFGFAYGAGEASFAPDAGGLPAVQHDFDLMI
jgi:hypothetical protein